MAVTDVDPRFGAIDAALKAATDAIDREDQAAAVAGLFGAVTGINALAVRTATTVAIPSTLRQWRQRIATFPGRARRDRGDVDPGRLQERLEKTLASVQKIVDKFGPDSFTVSAGFPLGVNVTLTWNATKKD